MMFNKFQVIVTQMKKKPYDYLDQRKMEFDSDFEDFKRQINDLHVSENNQKCIDIQPCFCKKTLNEAKVISSHQQGDVTMLAISTISRHQ